MWYTYKLWSTKDSFYYLGVRHCPSNRTPETDEYLGSGMSEEFKEWKLTSVENDSLRKEIIETFERSDQAYLAEELLVDQLYQTDANCLNASPGGKWNNRFLPVAPCIECSAGTGNHLSSCSFYKERGECLDCGGKSSNHKKACSKAVKCLECGASQNKHKKDCSLYKPKKLCDECLQLPHIKTCSKSKNCLECKGPGGRHKKICSLYVKRIPCGECNTTYSHKKLCSKRSLPEPCNECGALKGHMKVCSKRNSPKACDQCGTLSMAVHKKFCPLFKIRKDCDECGNQVGHFGYCSNFRKRCDECGSGSFHKKTCSRKAASTRRTDEDLKKLVEHERTRKKANLSAQVAV